MPATGYLKKARWTSAVLITALWLLAGQAAVCRAQGSLGEGNPRLANPRSHLGEPFEGKIFLAGHIAGGSGFTDHEPRPGWGGALIFRPGSTLNIFDGLFGWNAGMVLQADYLEIAGDGRIMSYDLILRRYFANRGDPKVEVRLFLGVGSGVSEIRHPAGEGGGREDAWSLLFEGGQEWHFKPHFHLFIKGQYRGMINSGRTYGTWTAMAGMGVTLP